MASQLSQQLKASGRSPPPVAKKPAPSAGGSNGAPVDLLDGPREAGDEPLLSGWELLQPSTGGS